VDLTARAAFEGVPRELERIALTLGKEPWQVFLTVTLPLARIGLAAALGAVASVRREGVRPVVADDVVVLHHGSVLSQGRPAEVRADPAVLEAYLGN